MIKEYRTISEVSGPLMLVKNVEGVTYDELGEIEAAQRRDPPLQGAGGRRRQRRRPAVRSSAGINLRDSKVRFLGHGLQLAVSEDMLGRVFDGLGNPIDGGPETCRRNAAISMVCR